MPQHENSDDLTLGEVSRRLDDSVTRLEALATRIEENYVRQDRYHAEQLLLLDKIESTSHRISRIESRAEWLTRTVYAFVVTAVLGGILYVNGGGNFPGH